MAMTWSNGSNKAACDARSARLNGGYVDFYTGGFATMLARVGLNATAFGAGTSATPSVATANATTRDPDAAAGGDAAAFRLVASDGTTVEGSGTVTVAGGGGDITLVGSVTIAAGQPFEIASLNISQS
jgi:hypothetical protein